MQHKYCFYGYRIVMVNGGWEQWFYSFMSWCILYWTQLGLGESQKMMEDLHIPVPQPLGERLLHTLLSQDWSSVLRSCHDKWAITMTTEQNAFDRGWLWGVVKRSAKVCEWTLIFENYLSESFHSLVVARFHGHLPANHKAEFSTDWYQCLLVKEGVGGGLFSISLPLHCSTLFFCISVSSLLSAWYCPRLSSQISIPTQGSGGKAYS